jgi:hypothetical protein
MNTVINHWVPSKLVELVVSKYRVKENWKKFCLMYFLGIGQNLPPPTQNFELLDDLQGTNCGW